MISNTKNAIVAVIVAPMLTRKNIVVKSALFFGGGRFSFVCVSLRSLSALARSVSIFACVSSRCSRACSSACSFARSSSSRIAFFNSSNVSFAISCPPMPFWCIRSNNRCSNNRYRYNSGMPLRVSFCRSLFHNLRC